ncbi:type IV pilus assembly protein PilM [Clostridium tetanomorphum]|uniref:Type IV pilus assembly protein PilM n=1 Tax=Clostridium tetanomorphum TaxID=1553 RepID=A0A923EEN0_CLOTT|nr:hypothetical protein [Clostridium tetanomorphum]KAJ53630.1 hypothetical protein CTM_01579 [Clostridium tetanomorphum DSM 665]MBC2399633.1 hypothetical protein [Clostridium tetanomorphum]MBP1866247.1 type IV pilus assembly protein PilM [Clostridium tetanomorphum]NRS86009.1 type IV pilus assembly protein PilM [Clostridium tetanomorphum]NRZ95970.1 type IV pilus assembly protein PilM [Clostridium tetanomorphum]
MLINNKVVFRFNEDSIGIVFLEYRLGKINIKKVKTITTENLLNGNFSTEENVDFTRIYLKKNKMLGKKAIAILSVDGIITRLVQVPSMGKKDLMSFIRNNINEYFTVNMGEYYYDYKIVEIEKDKGKKFNVLLVVIPKIKLKDVCNFLQSSGVTIERITIYPDCIADLFEYREEENIAILDFTRNKAIVTILEGDKIFLHSSSHIELPEGIDKDYEELLDNVGYFLNFYSSRHFGDRVHKIYLLGEEVEDEKLSTLINGQFDIPVERGIRSIVKKIGYSSDIDIDKFGDVLGCNLNLKEIYNKNIDFNKVINGHWEKLDNKRLLASTISILVLITVGWILFSNYYINIQLTKYNTEKLDKQIKRLELVNKEYHTLKNREKEYKEKERVVNTIKEDEFNYMYYLEQLKKGLPSNILVNSIYVDKEKIDLIVSINNSTLDKVKLVVAINNMGIFQHIEIDSIKLDNTETEGKFTLKIK